MRLFLLACASLVFLAGPAAAAALDPALQSQLLVLYDRYNKAISAGNMKEAMALRTAATQAQFQAELKRSPKAQANLLAMARDMTPETVEPLRGSLSNDGKTATIVTLGSKTVPANLKIKDGPKPGSVVKAEITLEFQKEGGGWKFANQTFGMDPSQIKVCTDETVEVITAYDQDRNLSFGGPIRRVDFKPDHTLLVIRVLDEENCAILPRRAELGKLGIKADALVPDTIVEMGGIPHKTDKQRAMVSSLRILPAQ
ncbi:MAG: hypothetical protein JSS43_04505 [Proteobacteria bacterium]|nr:hypothetical protein [Pseudomonadota bacterium]